MPNPVQEEREFVSKESEPSETDKLIDEWFIQNFQDSPVSRDTETYNHVHRAVTNLKKRFNEKKE